MTDPAPGLVAWFTGRPSSGKSTLARAVRDRLAPAGRAAVILDGDEVRGALAPRPGYAPSDRDAFYATLAGLAALLARQGLVVLVAATAHRRAYRRAARAASPRFLEVYVDVPAAECRARDAKGLYALAAAGDAPALPGAAVVYEAPRAPEVVARGGEDVAAADDVARRIAALCSRPPAATRPPRRSRARGSRAAPAPSRGRSGRAGRRPRRRPRS